ncbi:alpha/beta hydrolase [Hirschia baltica]|uniref:Esterase/lipase-like protein n=1 Tax=Hirschia baltica (strain ATCC 49814 / DSM 5838 / IFAM 1418) TaxID=582402 RepID=C6XPN1_HIRBI|nr:alpha/beta hydrolase [Hirschia baltica]ACT60296.1 esterase/lipase-like protein [Hirschia baltica ATCC 49814]
MKQIQFIKIACMLTSMTILPFSALAENNILLVDDGYTVSQRYEKNKEKYPEIEWPILSFQPGQTIQFDLAYKQTDQRTLHADIFRPSSEINNGGALLLVHGGGWRSGNKSHFYALANLLSARGYTVILPEYRLSIETPYPAGLLDINDAIHWAKQNCAQLGFNADKMAIGGASSGGHMASLIAYTSNSDIYKSKPDLDTSLVGLIDLDGVLDLTDPLAIKYENRMKEKSGLGLWFGGSMENKLTEWTQASPLEHIDANSPPTLIISSGQTRFTTGHQKVQEKLDKLDIANDFSSYDDILHTFWLFEPYASDVAKKIDQFLIQNTSINSPKSPAFQSDIRGE